MKCQLLRKASPLLSMQACHVDVAGNRREMEGLLGVRSPSTPRIPSNCFPWQDPASPGTTLPSISSTVGSISAAARPATCFSQEVFRALLETSRSAGRGPD
ncbi:hypothetical protein SKAU_G00232090 [Synaphobranchus kaupii]|uniref:Uncharacterized protein n=1 Tax=Synaphobranchus kaupii TaxID=118154 RepID=A0A9Q1F5Z9_SYNKA|nr:hypothetical protein SKAU_G00232090 [Synaphobranchus kaupii]